MGRSARCSGKIFVVAFAAAALAQAPKRAPEPKIEIREIKATGCIRKAASSRCLLLVTLDGESTYSFVTAPKPALNAVVTIQGKPHQGPPVCKQALEVDVSDWEPTGDMCAE